MLESVANQLDVVALALIDLPPLRRCKAGDLVYYYRDTHHVVIYVGNNWVVAASTYGQPVQMQKLDMTRYSGAGRPHGG